MKTSSEKIVTEVLQKVSALEVLTGTNNCDLIVKTENQTFYLQLLRLDSGYPGLIKKRIKDIEPVNYKYTILTAPFISEKSADLCKKANIGFCDEAGNCHISFGSVYISVSGKKNPNSSKRGLKSVFERSSVVSSKILRNLISFPNKFWKTEELAKIADCSLGQVAKVKKFLENNDWVIKADDGFKVEPSRELLNRWSEVYNTKPNKVINCYAYGSLPEIESQFENIRRQNGQNYWLTGFSGGNRYSPVVRYNRIHTYAQEDDVEHFIKQLDCKRVESGANLIFIIPYDECVLFKSRILKDSQVVSPLQIYLDCKPIKARGEEMAEEILREMKGWSLEIKA